MDINQTHLWNTIIHHQPQPQIDQSHHQTSTNFPSSFHHHHHPHLQSDHFPPPNFLSNQTENQVESTHDTKQQQQHNHYSQSDPFASPSFLRSQTKKQIDSTHDPMQLLRLENQDPSLKERNEAREGLEDGDHDHDEAEAEEEEEELGAMKEMMYRMAAMQPVEIDPASVRRPRRRNVRISDDPQSVAARRRRERISERIRILQRLVPGGTKLDTASMLEEAVRYVKYLKRQIRLLETTSDRAAASDHHIPPCSSAADGLGGFLGFGIGAAAAAAEDGVHVGGGGGGDHHGLVCFGSHEVISDP